MTVAQKDKVWTYEDYLALPDDGNRYEIIDGVLYMSPSPRTIHQVLSARVYDLLRPLEGLVLCAPLDVHMPGATPVQPDVVFVGPEQTGIITKQGIHGVPRLLVEILSPGNSGFDRVTKFNKYAACGVPHYWLLDPEERVLELCKLQQGVYMVLAALGPGDAFTHPDFDGLVIDVDALFANLPPGLL